MKELNGWPREDANVILIIEIILMSLFLTMNTADQALQGQAGAEHYTLTAPFWITSHFKNIFPACLWLRLSALSAVAGGCI